MTAPTITPRPLPPIGQDRFVRDVRTGWHIQLGDAWHLVLQAHAPTTGTGPALLVLRDGLHGTRDVDLPRLSRIPTRTPEEQIQHIEAQRAAAMPGRGLGPVSRIHIGQQTEALLRSALPRCDRCGAPLMHDLVEGDDDAQH